MKTWLIKLVSSMGVILISVLLLILVIVAANCFAEIMYKIILNIMFKIRKRKSNYESFNKEHPVGFIFYTRKRKQRFLYGKWKYIGVNVDGAYMFERIK